MPRLLAEYKTFWRQFRDQYHTTGAILPSSRFLARSLARWVGKEGKPQRILEVGPGTGAVTRRICRQLGPEDRFDLVELNDSFVAMLRERFEKEPDFQRVADRSRVIHAPLEQLSADEPYDLIISGLPLNNFASADVAKILGSFRELMAEGAILSFFEYIAIRPAKALVSTRKDRQRLREITVLLREMFHAGEFRRDWIWPNVPPAWVHHVRFTAG